MFKRLFGSKGKGGANASAEQAGEVAAVDKTEQCVQSMQEIRSTITQLEDKIKVLEARSQKNMNEAKEIMKKNKNDPRIKQLLEKVKQDRNAIQNYNNVIIKQERNITALDDAAFISEMFEIAEKTRDAMKKAVDGINTKIEELMAEIDEIREDIADTMKILTEKDEEEEDVSDLMAELNDMMDNEAAQQQQVNLPAVPTHTVTYEAPVQNEANLEDDLEAMLANI